MTNEQLRMQMLAGVITEGEYTAIINKQIEEADKESLNESMIGGIVGVGAVTQIPSREKTDYEMAFEHFLGERYLTNFENREQDPYKMEEVKENATPNLYMDLKNTLFPYYTDLTGEERVTMIDKIIKELNAYISILQNEKNTK